MGRPGASGAFAGRPGALTKSGRVAQRSSKRSRIVFSPFCRLIARRTRCAFHTVPASVLLMSVVVHRERRAAAKSREENAISMSKIEVQGVAERSGGAKSRSCAKFEQKTALRACEGKRFS